MDLIQKIDADQIAALENKLPDFKAGDTIRVGYKVTEELGLVSKIMKVYALPEIMEKA